MQILVPLAGKSDFFSPDQYYFPKPLIEVGGVPMIERVIENLKTIGSDPQFIFIVQQSDIARFSLDKTLNILTGGQCRIIGLRSPTRGALCSALMAIDMVDPQQPIIVSNGDQIIDVDFSRVFAKFQSADAGIIVFPSVHPRWSYAQVDAEGYVIQAAEKDVISRSAIAGLYYFKSAQLFMDCAAACLEKDSNVGGIYYTSYCLNEVILSGGRVISFDIETGNYYSLYSPEKIRSFEDEIIKQSISGGVRIVDRPVNLLVPAAGQGSRFASAGYAKPKPFIDVHGRPMITHVIDNVRPRKSHVHVLLRSDHTVGEQASVQALLDAGCVIHPVAQLTEGTACTLLLARSAFDNEDPMLVANSDQYVDFDVDAFVQDCIDRDLDGSILVFKDPAKDPKWSFARTDENGLVLEVAEKKPISDMATVGIYLFRRGSDFVSAAIDMIVRNDRVNNEFYTAPVYNYMIRNGLRIGLYEVPQAAMHGLGTPDDLQAFLALGDTGPEARRP